MSLTLSDEAVFEVTRSLYAQFLSEKTQKELDPDELDHFKKIYIKPLYPHKKNNQKYSCDEYCCDIDPGRFCCCQSTPPAPEYRQLGLGICLYVKFMKHVAAFFFLLAILGAFQIFVFEVAALNNGIDPLKDYHTALFSTTTGALSSQYSKCSYSSIVSNEAHFSLSCQSGYVNPLGAVASNQSLSNIKNCGREHSKLKVSSFHLSSQISVPVPTNVLNFTLPISSQIDSNQQIAYVYECVEAKYQLGKVIMDHQIFLYIVVGVDLLIVSFFILFLISEHAAQEQQVDMFKERQLAANDFTLQIKGFRTDVFQKQLVSFIQGYNSMVKNPEGGHFIENIVQIKVPQSEQISRAQQKRRKLYQKLYQLIQYCFLDDGIDLFRYTDAQDFIRRCYGTSDAPQFVQYKKQLSELVQQFMQNHSQKIYEDQQRNITILLTLSNPKHKRSMLRNSKHSCTSNYLKIDGIKYQLKEPPVADMVIWQNKHKHTCLRVIFAWFITLGICFCSYLLVGFAKWKEQQSLQSNSFNIDCSIRFTSDQLNVYNQSLSNNEYLHCYCMSNYFDWDAEASVRSTCSQWIVDYVVYQAIPLFISLGIVIYNLIVSRLFRVLSTFEAHKYLSQELYSYIIKRSFMLIMNMGLVIILLKLNYRSDFTIDNLSFLFMGVYEDITSDWYLEVGTIIILTLAINIMIPVMDMILVAFLKCLRLCWDRRCYCRKTSQKTKKGYIELYSSDVFPIQQRYSDFIAMIVITLAFSAVIPGLYIIAFLSLWLTFMCDKLLLFRVYQKPPNFTEDLQNNVFKVVYVSLMAHCVISPFLLSEPAIGRFGNLNSNNSRFLNILNTPYLIPYVILFLALAGWALFYSTIIRFCAYCSKKCTGELNPIYKQKLHQNFFKALNLYQVNRLKKSLEMQLHSCQDWKAPDDSNPIRIVCQNSLSTLIEIENRISAEVKKVDQDNNIRLIGKPGYDEIFDDELFNRDRKIKSIHLQFVDILKQERRKLISLTTMLNQNTLQDLNPCA